MMATGAIPGYAGVKDATPRDMRPDVHSLNERLNDLFANLSIVHKRLSNIADMVTGASVTPLGSPNRLDEPPPSSMHGRITELENLTSCILQEVNRIQP